MLGVWKGKVGQETLWRSRQREAGDSGAKLQPARVCGDFPGGVCARKEVYIFRGGMTVVLRGRRIQAARLEVGRAAEKGSTKYNNTTIPYNREGSRGESGKRGCRAGAPSSSVTNRPNGPGDRMIFARGCATQVGGCSLHHKHKSSPIEDPAKRNNGP